MKLGKKLSKTFTSGCLTDNNSAGLNFTIAGFALQDNYGHAVARVTTPRGI